MPQIWQAMRSFVVWLAIYSARLPVGFQPDMAVLFPSVMHCNINTFNTKSVFLFTYVYTYRVLRSHSGHTGNITVRPRQ
ncbi:hypothetical protein [Snodgrassella communis]|uniref:Uncharacterized protein n=1 Tax=Snodgrassella alvi TaxID=1196083 RepID=A0A2N9XTN2_9NEIS|nr:hypothetical protein [Snodgrassella communis]PIT52638.1 hypothetical protein BHC48_01810 [Snodgrassella communis]